MNTLKLVLCLGGSAGLSAYQDERTHSTRLQTQAFQHCHTVYLFAEHQQVHSRSDARATHVALPALNAPQLQQFAHSKGLVTPDGDAPISLQSRRWARWYFWQHQQLLWQQCERLLGKRPVQHDVDIVVLVDGSDCLASSVYLDCLYQLRTRYPNARCYPIFLLPAPDVTDSVVQTRAAAMVTELNAIGQQTWHPSHLDTGEPYAKGAVALWDVACVQRLHGSMDKLPNYPDLVANVLQLSRQTVAADSLQAALKRDFQKQCGKPNEVYLPRFVSLLQVTLQMNVPAVQAMVRQSVHTKLLQLLTHVPKQQAQTVMCTEQLLQRNWLVASEVLLLDRVEADAKLTHTDSVAQEWQTRGDFLLQKMDKNPDGDWGVQARDLAAQFQKIHDRHLRGMGAEVFYSVSQTRLERLGEQYGRSIEQQLWQACWQGGGNVSHLLLQFPAMFDYYQSLQERFEIEQRQVLDAHDSQQRQWDGVVAAWQAANKRERLLLQQQHPWPQLQQLLVARYTNLSRYKALAFALQFTRMLLPHYTRLHTTLTNIAALWQQQAQTQQALLQQQLAEQQQVWVKQVAQEGTHQYLLQATPALLHSLLQTPQVDLQQGVQEVLATWQQQFAETGDFEQWHGWLQQGHWQQLPERLATKKSHKLFQTGEQQQGQPLQQLFSRRMAELSTPQLQQLGKHAADTLRRVYQQQFQPLGKVLTPHSQHDECAAIICAPELVQQPSLGNWLGETAKRHHDRSVVLPSGGSDKIRFVLASTCYLPEWMGVPQWQLAYQAASATEQLAWHLHGEGSAQQWQQNASHLDARNRDLIRQQLLLAQVFNYLYFFKGQYCLNLDDNQAVVMLVAADLAALVESIPLVLVRQLLDKNRGIRDGQKTMPSPFVERQLEYALKELRQKYLPDGTDLADADWKDAGRYVVWVRAVQHIRQHWLNQPTQALLAAR